MVTERHRLRRLQMGEAGHHGSRVLLGARQERGLQFLEQPIGPVDRVAHPHPQDRWRPSLRERAVQLAAGLADQLGQARLDVHVDVRARR